MVSRVLMMPIIVVIIHATFMTGRVSAHPGWGLVVDHKGQIYFGDVDHNTIWQIVPNGVLNAVVTGKHSHDLSITSDGTVVGEHVYYVAAGNIWITSEWEFKPGCCVFDVAPSSADTPKGPGVMIDDDGNRYFQQRRTTNGREEVLLLKWTPGGKTIIFAGGARGQADGVGTSAQFMGIQDLTWGPEKALYATDGSAVRRISREGAVTTIAGNVLGGVSHGEHPRLLGIAVDKNGNIFVADYDHNCVRLITADGQVTTLVESGHFWSPSGVAILNDKLLILEHRPESPLFLLQWLSGPRVRERFADGRMITLGTVTRISGFAVGSFMLVPVIVGLAILSRRFLRVKRIKHQVDSTVFRSSPRHSAAGEN